MKRFNPFFPAPVWAPEAALAADPASETAEPVVAPASDDVVMPVEGADPPVLVLEGDGGGPTPFPEDWRAQMVGDAEDADKQVEHLQRMATPGDMYKSYQALKQQLNEKGVRVPGENASDKEKAAYNAAIGVPESIDKYEVPAVEGVEPTEADKVVQDIILTDAHAAGFTQDNLTKGFGIIQKVDAIRAQQRDKVAEDFTKGTEEHYRVEWGVDYEANYNLTNQYLHDAGLGEEFLSMRLEDGTPIGAHKGLIDLFIKEARANADAGDLVVGGAGNSSGDDETRHAELMALYNTDEQRYNSASVQQELQNIRNRMNRRNAA